MAGKAKARGPLGVPYAALHPPLPPTAKAPARPPPKHAVLAAVPVAASRGAEQLQ
jgi:hypothetical protein